MMSKNTAKLVLEGFKKNLKPGCDIDKALGVAIEELNKAIFEQSGRGNQQPQNQSNRQPNKNNTNNSQKNPSS